jgi:trehalose/maltose hydrolase-like predicted phosphorylase
MKALRVPALLCWFLPALTAQDSSFVLQTQTLTPYVRSYLGNGVFSLATSQLGTQPAESYMIRVYDHAKDDVSRIARLPAFNEVNVFNGHTWLNDTPLDRGSLRSWQQTLNTYDGCLRTHYDWAGGEQVISIEVESFVSRANPHLAAIRFQMTARSAGPVKVLLPIRAWKPPVRVPLARLANLPHDAEQRMPDIRYPGHMTVEDRQVDAGTGGATICVDSRADGSQNTVAEGMTVAWPLGLEKLRATRLDSDELAGVELSFQAAAGRAYTFYKYVGVASSFDSPQPAALAAQVAESARTRGYQALQRDSADAWHRLWQADILVEGDPKLQTVIHAAEFYLLGSVRAGTDFDVPPMGLSSAGYLGHIFWDSETFMVPALLLLHPELAKSMIMFRCRTLPAAQAKARENHYQGAMYPWEADESGAESTPRFAWQNALEENHVTSDVALAVWQYYLATGDREYLARWAWPVLKETADYWLSRATYRRDKDRYEILKVVSPDEGARGVSNDAVTNAGARRNVEDAIAAARLLGQPVNPEWPKFFRKIYIPYNAQARYHPEYEGAPAWKHNVGHVVALLAYPIALRMDEQTKRNDLENSIKSILSTGGGALLLPTIYPVVAAELGDRELIEQTLAHSYQPYIRPPFDVLNEGPRGESINFLTGTGLLQQFVYGYTGLRLSEKGLTEEFKPILPKQIKRLVLRNVTIRGNKYDLIVENNTLKRIEKETAQ